MLLVPVSYFNQAANSVVAGHRPVVLGYAVIFSEVSKLAVAYPLLIVYNVGSIFPGIGLNTYTALTLVYLGGAMGVSSVTTYGQSGAGVGQGMGVVRLLAKQAAHVARHLRRRFAVSEDDFRKPLAQRPVVVDARVTDILEGQMAKPVHSCLDGQFAQANPAQHIGAGVRGQALPSPAVTILRSAQDGVCDRRSATNTSCLRASAVRRYNTRRV